MLNFTSIVAIAAAVLVLGFCSSRGQSPEVVRFTSKPAPNENGIVSYCYPSSSTAQLQEMNSTVLTCSWPQGDRNFQAQLVFMMRMASQPETVTVTNRAGLEEYCIAKEPIQSTVTNDRHFVDLLINKTCYENKFGSEALTITCQENGINSRAITYQGEPCINGSTVPTPAMTPVLLDSSHTTATATSLTSESISVRPTPTHDQPSPPPSDTTSLTTIALIVTAVVLFGGIILTVCLCIFCIKACVKRFKMHRNTDIDPSSSNNGHDALRSALSMERLGYPQLSPTVSATPLPQEELTSESLSQPVQPCENFSETNQTSIPAENVPGEPDQLVVGHGLVTPQAVCNPVSVTPLSSDAPLRRNSLLGSDSVTSEEHPMKLSEPDVEDSGSVRSEPGFMEDSGRGTLSKNDFEKTNEVLGSTASQNTPGNNSGLGYGQEESRESTIANEHAGHVQRSS